MDIDSLAEDLTREEVVIGSTTFRISRMPPMRGYELLDDIRAMLGSQVVDALGTISSQQSNMDTIIASLLSLPHVQSDGIRKRLFEWVTFTRTPNVPSAQKLLGAEDMAFEGLDPGRVYEMMVRCFAVNFTDTLLRAQSSFLGGISDSLPLSRKQSPPS